jgi:hypothetical protein
MALRVEDVLPAAAAAAGSERERKERRDGGQPKATELQGVPSWISLRRARASAS